MRSLLYCMVFMILSSMFLQCSRSTGPDEYPERHTGCPPDIPDKTKAKPRPGLTGLKIVPLPDIKFEIQQGDWIDFGRLVGANINTRVVVTFAVRSDGSTEILQVDARGYPTAEITVVSAIRSWRYQKSCLTAEFTFVFHGRRGFYISRQEFGDPIDICVTCNYDIGDIHLVKNFR